MAGSFFPLHGSPAVWHLSNPDDCTDFAHVAHFAGRATVELCWPCWSQQRQRAMLLWCNNHQCLLLLAGFPTDGRAHLLFDLLACAGVGGQSSGNHRKTLFAPVLFAT